MGKLKLVVVLKNKGVSKLKMRPLEKIRFGDAGMLTALTACNDEILRKYGTVWTRYTAALLDLASSMHSYGIFGRWIL